MKKIVLLPLLIALILFSCVEKPTINGLWLVKSVTVGEEEMTPNARWMKFNSDSTQQSGNGFFQHSFGTWKLDQNKLRLSNENGLNDPFEAFDISFTESKMTWKRNEEGQPVVVNLERIDRLPLTYGDSLLGLWGLEKAIGNDAFFSETNNLDNYLFIRWDNRFVINSDSGRYSGAYQVNGHRPRLTLFPNSEQLGRSSWDILFKEDQVTLKKRNSDSLITRTFRRIYDFPE